MVDQSDELALPVARVNKEIIFTILVQAGKLGLVIDCQIE